MPNVSEDNSFKRGVVGGERVSACGTTGRGQIEAKQSL